MLTLYNSIYIRSNAAIFKREKFMTSLPGKVQAQYVSNLVKIKGMKTRSINSNTNKTNLIDNSQSLATLFTTAPLYIGINCNNKFQKIVRRNFSFKTLKSNLVQEILQKFIGYMECYLREKLETLIPSNLKTFYNDYFNISSLDQFQSIILSFYLWLYNNRLHLQNFLALLALLAFYSPLDYSNLCSELLYYSLAFLFLVVTNVLYLSSNQFIKRKFPLLDKFIQIAFFIILGLTVVYIIITLETIISLFLYRIIDLVFTKFSLNVLRKILDYILKMSGLTEAPYRYGKTTDS